MIFFSKFFEFKISIFSVFRNYRKPKFFANRKNLLNLLKLIFSNTLEFKFLEIFGIRKFQKIFFSERFYLVHYFTT